MAKGKYLKKLHLRRTLLLTASLVLILSLSVGGILAWLTTNSAPVTNTFTPSQVTTSVTEERDGNVKSNVKIQNTGDVTAWIRAAVVVTWQNEAGEVYGAAPQLGLDYERSTLGEGWIAGDDNFFYHAAAVDPGDSTKVMFAEFKPVEGRNPDGYYLTVEIISSGIQYKPQEAFDAWATGSGITWSESGLSK